ncbi:HD domain-containing protein [Candidatus Woesearchaeota archaeon]|nr:HD domain-containing protein [Candidatus Woesearchaeota archaeon]
MSYLREVKELDHIDREYGLGIKHLLRKEEFRLLARLCHRHRKTVIHSFNVAADCEYVGRALGLKEEQIERLKVAALLHDVGKLDMELIVLDKGVGIIEQEAILREKGIEPKGNVLAQITLRDLIEYRSRIKGRWPGRTKRVSWHEKRRMLRRLGDEADVTIWEHIKKHQYFTEKRLLEAGTDPRIVAYAARHHPEYLGKKKPPLDISILSTVDKFNAMTQSEGKRNYKKRLGRAEALDLLAEKLRQPKMLVKILAEKYVPIEENELLSIHGEMLRTYRKTWLTRILSILRLDVLLGGGIVKRKPEIERLKRELEVSYGRA